MTFGNSTAGGKEAASDLDEGILSGVGAVVFAVQLSKNFLAPKELCYTRHQSLSQRSIRP